MSNLIFLCFLFSKGEELNFDLEGLDTTWNDSQAVDVSDDDEDLKIPQFDGANDEKPKPGEIFLFNLLKYIV